jgi:Helix-turn-helix domain
MPTKLRTSREAAELLRCSLKTLKGYVETGAIRYVTIGHGARRPRRMFTDGDLDALIESQARKDAPECPSSAIRARHISGSTSNGEVIAFSAQPRPKPAARRKP